MECTTKFKSDANTYYSKYAWNDLDSVQLQWMKNKSELKSNFKYKEENQKTK